MLIIIGLSLKPFADSAYAAEESPQLKELNLVFLHGAGGTSCDLQLLADSIMEQSPFYVSSYEQAYPGTGIQINALSRCYPSDVDILSWANNIADAIDKYFSNKNNLVLIGHSMGGKAALYAVARDVKGLADKVSMVVTINTPVKSLNQYVIAGGGSVANYCRFNWLLSDHGVCDSLGNYDSSTDGSWVGHNKHWLAFISAESAPSSPQFDIGRVDGYPRDMDDGQVPISAQYSEGADAIYYGEHAHGDFKVQDEVARYMAGQILRYIFGGTIECSVPTGRTGTLEHRAGWLPVKNSWDDMLGEVPASNGTISNYDDSFLRWEDWEDVIGGDCPPGNIRSSYSVRTVESLPLLTRIIKVGWFSPVNPEDCRLDIKTRAAPKNRIRLEWSILRHELLPQETKRDHYEIKVLASMAQAGITQASWAADDPRDTRLLVNSQAEGPFRWLYAEWKVYSKESRQRKVIDEIPGNPVK